MTCAELVELVTEYLEDRLAAGETARLEAHLALCEPCGIYIEQMRQSIAILGRLTEDDLPPGAADALLAGFRDWKRSRA